MASAPVRSQVSNSFRAAGPSRKTNLPFDHLSPFTIFVSPPLRSDQNEANEPECDIAVPVSQSENDGVVIHQSAVRHQERSPEPIHQNRTDKPQCLRVPIERADRV